MGKVGSVSDAWEVLANIGGNRGYLASCALEALPNVQGGRDRMSGARSCRNGYCVVRGGHCC
jgi:hypothetical protein